MAAPEPHEAIRRRKHRGSTARPSSRRSSYDGFARRSKRRGGGRSREAEEAERRRRKKQLPQLRLSRAKALRDSGSAMLSKSYVPGETPASRQRGRTAERARRRLEKESDINLWLLQAEEIARRPRAALPGLGAESDADDEADEALRPWTVHGSRPPEPSPGDRFRPRRSVMLSSLEVDDQGLAAAKNEDLEQSEELTARAKRSKEADNEGKEDHEKTAKVLERREEDGEGPEQSADHPEAAIRDDGLVACDAGHLDDGTVIVGLMPPPAVATRGRVSVPAALRQMLLRRRRDDGLAAHHRSQRKKLLLRVLRAWRRSVREPNANHQ